MASAYFSDILEQRYLIEILRSELGFVESKERSNYDMKHQ